MKTIKVSAIVEPGHLPDTQSRSRFCESCDKIFTYGGLGPMLVAFVLMKTEPAHLDTVVKALVEMEIVEEMHSLAGDYDLIVKIRVDDFEQLARLVVDRIQRVPHLRETKTLIAFDAYNVPKLRGS